MSTDPIDEFKWTYEKYAEIPHDGKRHEIIDSRHYASPTPNIYHQQVSRRIQYQLYTAIELAELGVVIYAPVDVQLSDYDILQPDLVIIGKPRSYIITPTKVKGTPDLVVEILSPSNPNHDLVTKRQAYQRCGVPEYWIVFPDEHRILQLTLVDGNYQETICTTSITMNLAPHTVVDLTKVW